MIQDGPGFGIGGILKQTLDVGNPFFPEDPDQFQEFINAFLLAPSRAAAVPAMAVLIAVISCWMLRT
jgi:hypothetical protein